MRNHVQQAFLFTEKSLSALHKSRKEDYDCRENYKKRNLIPKFMPKLLQLLLYFALHSDDRLHVQSPFRSTGNFILFF